VSYFLLVFALSIPFWVVGAVTGLELRPGLPVAALMAVCPAAAAVILIARGQGRAGVLRWLSRCFDRRRIGIGYLPILGLMPLVMLLSYGMMRVAGLPLPERPEISLVAAPGLFVGFLLASLGEELGWSGYALGPMQGRWGGLRAGLVLGMVWALWHLVPLIQTGRSAEWIAGWSLGTVANRVIIVRLFNATGGSVVAAALYHAMINLSWQLFPNHGSHYDPRVTGLLLTLVALGMVASSRSREPRRHLVVEAS
jgi:uncharacterized protein